MSLSEIFYVEIPNGLGDFDEFEQVSQAVDAIFIDADLPAPAISGERTRITGDDLSSAAHIADAVSEY